MIERINVFAGNRTELIRSDQYKLMQKVYDAIKHYYDNLYKTRPCYKYPLNLYRLMLLTKLDHRTIRAALHLLESTIPATVQKDYDKPLIYISQRQSKKNKSHVALQIFLTKQ